MAYQKVDYVYIIAVTLLFIFQLYCFLIRQRDVLLSILFPVAIIFTFIIGVKRFFNKSALKEDETQDETTEGETTFRLLFLVLNIITFIIFILYCIKVPAVAFREIRLNKEIRLVETDTPNEFVARSVQFTPPIDNVKVDPKVRLVSYGSMNPISKVSIPENDLPQVIEFGGRNYELIGRASKE